MEDDIAFIRRHGVREFEREQKKRERLLVSMLEELNEGRSLSFYCIAATILPESRLREARACARRGSKGVDLKSRARVLHGELDRIARETNTSIKLRR